MVKSEKRAKQRTSGQYPAILDIPLGNIQGLHPEIERLLTDLDLPPLREPPVSCISEAMLECLLVAQPIRVVLIRKVYKCVGGIRSYHAACRHLSDDTPVTCITDAPASNVDRFRARAVAELLQLPALAGAHFSDIPLLYGAFSRAVEKQLAAPTDGLSANYFARLYGGDARRLTRTTEEVPARAARASDVPIANPPSPTKKDVPAPEVGERTTLSPPEDMFLQASPPPPGNGAGAQDDASVRIPWKQSGKTIGYYEPARLWPSQADIAFYRNTLLDTAQYLADPQAVALDLEKLLALT